jgi:hypothetical protein
MLAYLARVPNILSRVRTNTNGHVGLLELQAEMKELYTKTRAICTDFAAELAAIEANKSTSPLKLPPLILHAHVQRMYGLCITITLYMNYALVAIRTVDHSLATDATFLAFEMLNIAEKAAKYRPFGAAYVTIGLVAALMTVNNEALKTLLKASIIDYQQDFRQPHLDKLTMESNFQWLDPFRSLDLLANYGITDECFEVEQNVIYTPLTSELEYGVDSGTDFAPELTPEFTLNLGSDFVAEFPPVSTPDSTSDILSDTNFELPADLTLEMTSDMNIKLRV